jgi:HEAT repeat protein
MELFFCPNCRSPSIQPDHCPQCNLTRNGKPETYTGKLLATILSNDPTRVGMAIDVLTTWMHEPKAVIPLLSLLQSPTDAHRLVMAARGLGRLGDNAAVPALIEVLKNAELPFVARIASAQALGELGGKDARQALEQASHDPQRNVARAAQETLEKLVLEGE